MKYTYKRIDITTLNGLKKAEKLKTDGWVIVNSTPFTLIFEKKI